MQNIRRYIKENRSMPIIIAIIIMLFIIIQFCVVHFLDITQYSDFQLYLKLSRNVVNTGNMYPDYTQVFSRYIPAPGYVNFLALLILIFKNNVRHVLYFNILLNLILLGEVYFLASKIKDKLTGKIAIVLFCLYLTNYAIILYTCTDLIFAVLAYGALCLFLKDKYKYYLISGIMLALANWIRALMLPFIFVMIIFFVFKRKNYKKIIAFFIGIGITCSTIGLVTYKSFGYFNFQSITTGLNLIIGANDKATGKYNDSPFLPGGLGYGGLKSNMTVKEKDKYWVNKSVAWIKKHPIKYIELIPVKTYYMYNEDNSFVYKLANSQYDFVRRVLFGNNFLFQCFMKVFRFITSKGNFIYYICLLIMSLIGTILAVLKKEYSFLIFSGLIFFITGLTIELYGNDRYHYPCMFAVIILTAYSIEHLYIKCKGRLAG